LTPLLFLLLALFPLSVEARTASEWQAAGWVTDFERGLEQVRTVDRPAFVYFDAAWCGWCQQYERETLSRPEVQQVMAQAYVSVRVDWDARPDLVQRYGAKGLPFSLILSREGQVLNAFVGILGPQDLIDLLKRAGDPAAPTREAPATQAVEVRSLDRQGFDAFRAAYLQHLESLYDPERQSLAGRFQTGTGLKWPSPRTWVYLLEQGLWPERVQAAATAERQRLLDRIDGGFFNYLDPHYPSGEYSETSKLLEGNAWMSAWLAQVGTMKGDPGALRAARAGYFFLREVLWDKEQGGLWQAQIANTDYYRLPPAARLNASPPPLDRAKRADTNAQAAWALLRIGHFTRDPQATALGVKALDFVLNTLIRDEVLFHLWRDGQATVPGIPQSGFWVLAAGAEVQTVRPDRARQERLCTVAQQARRWIEQQMATPEPLPVDLVGLIAWVSTSELGRSTLPRGALGWALAQLRIEPDTRPDDLVLGLMAWERGLSRTAVSLAHP
jgi:thioredoxin-related protein